MYGTKKKYRIGIIGYGGFGKFLHHWWEKLDNVEIVAIADSKIYEKQVNGQRIYRHWEELIDDDEVDIVSIVTPPSVHAEIACAAMRKGKNVLIEKPVAISEEQIRSILEARDETQRVVMVDHMLRYNPLIDQLSALGRKGVFGKLKHAVVSNYAQDASLSPDHWFWNRDFSGGIFVEHGVHFIDIINGMTPSSITEVKGFWSDRNEKQRDVVTGIVKYADGGIAHHYHRFAGPGFFEETTIQLTYDLARIILKGWVPLEGTVKALVNEDTKDQLTRLPGFEMSSLGALSQQEDHSRPEGWGEEGVGGQGGVNFGGINYNTDIVIEGSFGLKDPKGEVYGKCVQDIISDMIKAIEDPQHRTKVTLEDAIRSVEVALEASR